MDSREVFMLLGKGTDLPVSSYRFVMDINSPVRDMSEYPWGMLSFEDENDDVLEDADDLEYLDLSRGNSRTTCCWSLAAVDAAHETCLTLDVEIGFEYKDITNINAYSNPFIAGRNDGWIVHSYRYKCSTWDIEDIKIIRQLLPPEHIHGRFK